LVLGEAERLAHTKVMRLLRRPPPGREQALGPRAGSSEQQ